MSKICAFCVAPERASDRAGACTYYTSMPIRLYGQPLQRAIPAKMAFSYVPGSTRTTFDLGPTALPECREQRAPWTRHPSAAHVFLGHYNKAKNSQRQTER